MGKRKDLASLVSAHVFQCSVPKEFGQHWWGHYILGWAPSSALLKQVSSPWRTGLHTMVQPLALGLNTTTSCMAEACGLPWGAWKPDPLFISDYQLLAT